MPASRKYHYKEIKQEEWTRDDETRYRANQEYDSNQDHHSGSAGKTLAYLKGKTKKNG